MISRSRGSLSGRGTALDVGCGPGFVAEIMKQKMEMVGVDIDVESVGESRSRGIDGSVAAGEFLPFADDSFDLVYCTFLLLWVKDPRLIVSEMKRVSKRWIACLAEPDYGGRIGYPDSLSKLDDLLIEGVKEAGGDPYTGRKLSSIFSSCGMTPEIGIHPGAWNVVKLREESSGEWRHIEMTTTRQGTDLERLRKEWDMALDNGSLFQFNPIFYAVAEK